MSPTRMDQFYVRLGDFDRSRLNHNEDYFVLRGIWLDCRGTLLIDGSAALEWGVKIITLSHPVRCIGGGPDVDRPVVIDANAWICSFALLYNCHVGVGAVVAAGSVVRSQDVPPWTMVAGNPARIIARFDHESGEWRYLVEPEILPWRMQ